MTPRKAPTSSPAARAVSMMGLAVAAL